MIYFLSIAAAAMLLGVHVQVFGIGQGAVLFGFCWRGTDWRLSALQIGGYIKLAGDDRREGRDFDRLERAQRVLVQSPGPLSTILLGLILLTDHT